MFLYSIIYITLKKIVTIGGGSGSPVVNEALLRTNKVGFIKAIVTPFDNGGSTQIRRLNSQGEIAYSDAIRILFSLIPPNHQDDPKVQIVKNWFLNRDSKNNVLGQEIINRYFDKKTGFASIQSQFQDLGISLKGKVIPSSTTSSHIVFTTQTGAIYKGENLLDLNRFSADMVTNMQLDPTVPAFAEAKTAIEEANLIILSCGSMHGSVLCNFLPRGMKGALKKSEAKIYLVTNLFTTRNETDNLTPISLGDLIQKYTGVKITGFIVPKISRQEFEKKFPEVATIYKIRESSYFLGWEKSDLDKAKKAGYHIITHDAVKIVDIPEKNMTIVRHDPQRLSKTFGTLI